MSSLRIPKMKRKSVRRSPEPCVRLTINPVVNILTRQLLDQLLLKLLLILITSISSIVRTRRPYESAAGGDSRPNMICAMPVNNLVTGGRTVHYSNAISSTSAIHHRTINNEQLVNDNPSSMYMKNNKSALQNNEFVSNSVNVLSGCVIEVPLQPYIVNPLSVATQKSRKRRLILDLSTLNLSVKKEKIKLENWKIAVQYFQKNDACSIADDACTVELESKNVHTMWKSAEMLESSTWRIVQAGSVKEKLQNIAISIFSICSQKGILINIQWIPRGENLKADYISKTIDYEDWGVSEFFYTFINDLWGPYTMDCFASSRDAKLEGFNSLSWNVNTEAVDYIFRVGRWIQNSDSSDELSTLKARLPEYCLSSRSLNTRKKYQYAFNAFCKWTKLHNITPLPSSDYTVLFDSHFAECKIG
ncbi:unnamed protein product [Mytilus coruscus]|uniref:Uncharacterized protein n=1 Tax=Mytilus coruscus TaxID=42192 RepID=A0A6J7ZXI5_MYTCO|nr:unnamed protein product [Mytilus coruscus]